MPEEEALKSGDYCKLFSLDGVVTRKEYYYQHDLDSVYWYTDSIHGVSELLTQLRLNYPQGSIVLVKREPYLDYTVETAHWYEGEVPVYTGGALTIYTHLSEELYSRQFDEHNQTEEVFKTFYDGIEYYRFCYSAHGALDRLEGWSEFQESLNRSEIDYFLPGFIQKHPYFADDTPFPQCYSKEHFVLKEKPKPVVTKRLADLEPTPETPASFYRRYAHEIWLSAALLLILLVLFLG